MGMVCSTHDEDEEYLQDFGREIWGENSTWKI
jgi:hypothetical protein